MPLSHGSPSSFDSDDCDNSDRSSPNLQCQINSNDGSEVNQNLQPSCIPSFEVSRGKDRMRIKELESEIRVLQVYVLYVYVMCICYIKNHPYVLVL